MQHHTVCFNVKCAIKPAENTTRTSNPEAANCKSRLCHAKLCPHVKSSFHPKKYLKSILNFDDVNAIFRKIKK